MTCRANDCARATIARGLCGKHYQRFMRYGDPNAPNLRGQHTDNSGERNPRWNGWATKHRLYWIYQDMVRRCTAPAHRRWKDYGGRGINVCRRWRASFWNFVADMGERADGLVLDRMDNNGDYKPSNCRWTTYLVSNHNRRPTSEWKRRAG